MADARTKRVFGTHEMVVAVPARQTLDLEITIDQINGNVSGCRKNRHVCDNTSRHPGEGDPVEAPGTPVLVGAGRAEHDVVAILGVVIIISFPHEHIVAQDGAIAEGGTIVALEKISRGTTFNPVVSFIAENNVQTSTCIDEVVAEACEGFRITLSTEDRITAISAKEQIKSTARIQNDVMTVAGLDVVITKRIRKDVVTSTSKNEVVTGSTFKGIIAFVTVNGVITLTRGKAIIAGCAPQHHMFDAVVSDGAVGETLQQRGFAGRGLGVVEDGPCRAQTASLKPVGGC